MQKKVEIKSNTIQNTMVITCTAKIKSNSTQNIMMVTCMQKKVKIRVQISPEQDVDHLPEKEGKVQVQLNPKCHDGLT